MSDAEKPVMKAGVKSEAARRERQAAQLRANLRRRKAQGRSRDAAAGEEAPPPPSPHDDG